MRVLIAAMSHETNTFSPVPTNLERFSPAYGQDAIDRSRGGPGSLSAFIDLLEAEGADIVCPIAAGAPPSGPVEAACYAHMTDTICDAIDDDTFDAVFLALHGAMVTETHDDGEGTLLKRIRGMHPDMPIAVALDMHTNFFPDMAKNATVISGYVTYPHVDGYGTGERAGRALIRSLKGEVDPVMVWGNRPMLPHVMRQGTDDFPNKDLQARVLEMEQMDEVLSATLFTGFPHADIVNAGLSAVVVTDGDQKLAEELRDELLDFAWDNREAFVYEIDELDDSLSRAGEIAAEAENDETRQPVVLLDHYDNTASGGTMDSTTVLQAILDQGLTDVAVAAIFDPEVVEQMMAAGVGATIDVSLGGKTPMPAIPESCDPISLTGTVKLLSDGRFKGRADGGRQSYGSMGRSGVLSCDGVDIIVLSRHIEPVSLDVFKSMGIDPTEKKYLMIKSRIHYRTAFVPIAKAVVECAGVGVCTSDYNQLEFKNVRRPIFPLDLANE